MKTESSENLLARNTVAPMLCRKALTARWSRRRLAWARAGSRLVHVASDTSALSEHGEGVPAGLMQILHSSPLPSLRISSLNALGQAFAQLLARAQEAGF